jgi:uncharacterized protein (UPF0332 family)
MKEATQKLLEKAAQAVHTSERSLEDGDIDASANRVYYSMFYVAEALLNEKDLRFKKHGGVHAAFGEQFAKTSVLDPKYHRWLLQAFNKRVSADYETEAQLQSEDIQALIQQAHEFLKTAQDYLAGRP